MGNIIYAEAAPDSEPLLMSNGSTSVLVAVLTLAGSEIASNDWERDVLAWIATNDQSVFGIGCVGFDIAELGWNKESFGIQKQFLLDVVERVRVQTGWELLSFEPNLELVDDLLMKLESLIVKFQISHCFDQPLEWKIPPHDKPTKCSIHGIFEHQEGCVICNDP